MADGEVRATYQQCIAELDRLGSSIPWWTTLRLKRPNRPITTLKAWKGPAPRPCFSTKPKLERAREYEARLDVEGLIQRALDGIEVTPIYPNEKFLDDKAQEDADLL